MATTLNYIEYVCECLKDFGHIRYRKMFGEYMVYLNDKPILLVCDHTVYVKILDEIKEFMENSDKGFPYQGAKEHYILELENNELLETIIPILEKVTPIPKSKKKA